MWFEIKPCHKRSFLLCFVYRKPSELVEWIDKFEFELNNAISFNSDIVLTGDFNMNLLPPVNHHKNGCLFLKLTILNK